MDFDNLLTRDSTNSNSTTFSIDINQTNKEDIQNFKQILANCSNINELKKYKVECIHDDYKQMLYSNSVLKITPFSKCMNFVRISKHVDIKMTTNIYLVGFTN